MSRMVRITATNASTFFMAKIRNGSKASLFCHPYYLRYHHDPKNIGTKRCMTKEAVIFLFIAIVVEVIATISLKLSDSFTRLVPSLVTIIGYCIAFLVSYHPNCEPSLLVSFMPFWSGVGIVLIGLIGWLFLGQKLDMPAIIGMLLIICGVIVINLFSKSVSH
ncbi:Multidrug transporter emrE Efflux-multidrug resistance protein emrE; Methyl viologen resistance protein C; Ethidium resistance protein [Salmonella enterica subsp. enterica]|uniref:Multidrug transporter emrE Efflux-multidrug resistance protein emrE Methyl viologen resistance protein C Ethidium resistance protein n=2 Tax=Salmonella enterica TaxID=28901 RepID=A0A3S4ITQ5_SALET|nr:Multidrug transporter emrE Efflux-multidrug resistance protein emrE; Methyl viologen resistance protein C; Ethidium resistance protein [Salmonella enterica subsp. enterica]